MKKINILSMIVLVALLVMPYKQALGNETLIERISTAIPYYYQNDINVTVENNGIVKLEGNVNTLYDKDRIFEIVARIPGVSEIKNDILIKSALIPDDEIRNNIIQEMKLVSAISEPGRIKVTVNDGIVFLDGTVSYYREKMMAKSIASWQKGVKGIQNNLVVLPHSVARSDENLQKMLSQVMEYNFPLEHNVTFKVKDGVVTLNGTTTTLWAKNNIPEEFSKIIGIKKVKNNLKVYVKS